MSFKTSFSGKMKYLFTGISILAILLSICIKKCNNTIKANETQLGIYDLDKRNTQNNIVIENKIPESHTDELTAVITNEEIVEPAIIGQGFNINEFVNYNPSTIAAVNIPGTTIYFPIVSSTDDTYWLSHNFSNEESIYGSIFLDFTNNRDFSDKVSTIFGHNMKDYRMFTNLNKYVNSRKYFLEREYAFISTLDYIHVYKFAFASKVPSNINEVRKAKYKSDQEYGDFIETLKSYALVENEGIDVNNLKLLQFLTCNNDPKYRTATYFSYQYSLPNILSS